MARGACADGLSRAFEAVLELRGIRVRRSRAGSGEKTLRLVKQAKCACARHGWRCRRRRRWRIRLMAMAHDRWPGRTPRSRVPIGASRIAAPWCGRAILGQRHQRKMGASTAPRSAQPRGPLPARSECLVAECRAPGGQQLKSLLEAGSLGCRGAGFELSYGSAPIPAATNCNNALLSTSMTTLTRLLAPS